MQPGSGLQARSDLRLLEAGGGERLALIETAQTRSRKILFLSTFLMDLFILIEIITQRESQ